MIFKTLYVHIISDISSNFHYAILYINGERATSIEGSRFCFAQLYNAQNVNTKNGY